MPKERIGKLGLILLVLLLLLDLTVAYLYATSADPFLILTSPIGTIGFPTG